jgi:hypothetical protein
MSKQKTLRFKGDHIMKLFAVTALLAVASLSTAARALSPSSALQAEVPFNFTVGYKQLPSGNYIIKCNSGGVITVESIDHQRRVVFNSITKPESTRGDKLIFRKYGDHYFLGKVSSSAFSADFPSSKLETSVRDHEERPFGTN